MPVTTHAEPGNRFQVLLVIDPYVMDEWRTVMLEVLATPEFRRMPALLIDYRTSHPPTYQFIEAMTDFFGQHAPELDGANAAIVTCDEASFGMARMTEIKAERQNPTLTIHAFRSYAEGTAWLTERTGRSPPGRARPKPAP